MVRAMVSGQWQDLGTLSGHTVDDLCRHGLLVTQPDGTLVRKPVTAESARADRRPRPPEGSIAFNDAESPLAWLRTRRDKAGQALISDDQFRAGERLRADFERSMLSGRVTASWNITASSGRGPGALAADISDGAIAARQRFHAAMDAAGPELSSILYQVCCMAAGLEHAERLLGLPQRSGKAVLGLALNALVRHYGMAKAGRGAKPAHWSLPDFRPSIQELEDA